MSCIDGVDGRTDTWDARYAASCDRVPAPADVLTRFADALPAAGKALDLACGRAGSGEWLGARGFEVTAIDASSTVIEAIRARPASRISISLVQDVRATPPPRDAFDVIVVARFLERAACADIAAALRPGGTLFYQTFSAGLSNPAFVLRANELPALFDGLDVLHYLDPPVDRDGRAQAMLVARDRRSAG